MLRTRENFVADHKPIFGHDLCVGVEVINWPANTRQKSTRPPCYEQANDLLELGLRNIQSCPKIEYQLG
jgi:hypothetical protein